MPEYGEKSYWDNFYGRKKEPFEWLGDFSLFSNFIRHNARAPVNDILIPGCGNSKLPHDVQELFPESSVLAVDYSETLIEEMSKKYTKKWKNVSFMCGDCLSLDQVPDRSFDLIVDKSTLDAICCRDASTCSVSSYVDYHPDGVKYLLEMGRLIRPNGTLIIISYSSNRIDEIKHVLDNSNLFSPDYKTDKVMVQKSKSANVYEPEIFHNCFALKRNLS
jgi:SAM-dependent methyltransferase